MKGLIVGLVFFLAIGVLPADAARKPESLRVQVNQEKRFPKSRIFVRFVELVG